MKDAPRTLLVLRHGKSDWSDLDLDDIDRPLARRGRKAVKAVSRWARREALIPDAVVSSPARRARDTAARFCRGAGLDEHDVRAEESIYEAGLADLLDLLGRFAHAPRCLMLVGHNPGLEMLVAHLGGAEAGPVAKPMPTAALAEIRMPRDWRRLPSGCGEVLRILRPREL